MNRNILLIIAGLVIVGGAAFFILNRPGNDGAVEETSNSTDQSAPTATPGQEFTLTLAPQNDSSESGTAIFVEENGKVKVTLNLTGVPKGVTQPAHIHVGSCPGVGDVKYGLTSAVDGKSETTLDVSLDQIRSELPLGLNVHKSEDEAKVYVSCGDVTL